MAEKWCARDDVSETTTTAFLVSTQHWKEERTMPTRYITDSAALNIITDILSGTEWSPDTLERIAEIVKETGRVINEPNSG